MSSCRVSWRPTIRTTMTEKKKKKKLKSKVQRKEGKKVKDREESIKDFCQKGMTEKGFVFIKNDDNEKGLLDSESYL